MNGSFWEYQFDLETSGIGALAEGPLSTAQHPTADSPLTAQLLSADPSQLLGAKVTNYPR